MQNPEIETGYPKRRVILTKGVLTCIDGLFPQPTSRVQDEENVDENSQNDDHKKKKLQKKRKINNN